MTRRQRYIYTSWLGVAASCLVVSFLAVDGGSNNVQGGPSPALPDLQTAIRRPPKDFSAFRSISNRPLFSQDRRPFMPRVKRTDPPAAIVVSAPTAPPDYILVAVAIGPGRRVAILKPPSDKSQLLHEGEGLQGWVITHIEPGGVLVRHGTQEAVVNFAKRPTNRHPGSAWSLTGLTQPIAGQPR